MHYQTEMTFLTLLLISRVDDNDACVRACARVRVCVWSFSTIFFFISQGCLLRKGANCSLLCCTESMWYQIPDTLIHSTPSPYNDTGVTSPITTPNILVASKMQLVSVRTILVCRDRTGRFLPIPEQTLYPLRYRCR